MKVRRRSQFIPHPSSLGSPAHRMRLLLSSLCLAFAAALAPAAPRAQPERLLPADVPGEFGLTSRSPLDLPAPGSHALHVVAPNVLELLLITTKSAGGAVDRWDFGQPDGSLKLPGRDQFLVTVD